MSKTKDVYEDLKEYVKDIKKRISLQEDTLLELKDDIRGIERVKTIKETYTIVQHDLEEILEGKRD